MRFSTLVAGCVWLCLPLVALAIPPRDPKKAQAAKPAGNPAAAFITPSSGSGGPKLPGAGPSRGGMASIGNRPSTGKQPISMLPDAGNIRPGANGGGVAKPLPGRPPQDLTGLNRPGLDRPVKRPPNNRPDVVVNRPDININRPTLNRPEFNVNRPTNINNGNQVNINRPINITNNTVNNTTVNNNTTVINKNYNQNIVNRPVNNFQVNSGNQVNNNRPRDYYPQLHNHWQPTSWSGGYRPAYYNYSYTAVSGGGSMTIGGASVAFANPFYVQPAVATAARFDYSQPIQVPPPNYQETEDDLVRSERAIRRFDDAREVYRRGEYGRASELIDEAIELLPNDPSLHQLRSMILFARGRYQESSAVLYSVLAVAPGWDTATIAKLYDDPKRYLAQVDDLEKFVAAHPEATDSQFLLACHSLVKGDVVAADRLLDNVRTAKPNDRVVQNLLLALRG